MRNNYAVATMRWILPSLTAAVLLVILSSSALAQPTPAPSTNTATTAQLAPVYTPPVPVPPSAGQLRATCTAAMNADPKFADDLLRVLDEKKVVELAKAQEKFAAIQVEAGERIAKNEKHVIMAYAAMWLAAVVFLIFMWSRQRGLRSQIDALRNDLAAALKEPK
jgi:hypothetical protein